MRWPPAKPHVALAAFVVAALAAPGPARTQSPEVGVTVTDTFTGEWRASNQNADAGDDDYGAFLNRLALTGTAGGLTAGAEVDSFYFVDEPTDELRDNTILERIWAEIRTGPGPLGDWRLVAGDFRLQLGRGIVVSLRKEADVGLDLALRGGRVELTAEPHRLALFAGRVNPANIDGVSQRAVADVDDVMAGASWELDAFDAVDVALYGLYLEPEERLLDERDYSASGGLSVEVPEVTDWLALYAEADVQRRELAGISERGYAGYLVADVLAGDSTLLVEGLWLDAFEQLGSRNTALGTRFQYNRPPTLERIEEEVLQNRDVVGGRLRFEHTFYEIDLSLFANGTIRLNDRGEPGEVRQLHGYGGLEVFFGEGRSRFALSGGYRDELQEGRQVRSLGHGELDYLQALSQRTSLHIDSVTERRTLVDTVYYRGHVITGVEWSAVGSLSFELGYDTQDPSPNVANVFYAGILTWESLDWLDVRLTGGTQRGGIKCVAGVCRDFPEFAGFRAEIVVRN